MAIPSEMGRLPPLPRHAVPFTERNGSSQRNAQLTWKKGRNTETTLLCMGHIRRVLPGATISVEVEKPGRAALEELAAEADAVFYSRSWAEVGDCQPPCLEMT